MLELNAKEQAILKMIQRATKAGGSLTLKQIRERIRDRNGHLYKVTRKLSAAGLVTLSQGEDWNGSISVRATK